MSWNAARHNKTYRDSNRDAIIKHEQEELDELFGGYEDLYDMWGGCGYEECCPGSSHIGLDKIYISFLAGLLYKLRIKSAEDLMSFPFFR